MLPGKGAKPAPQASKPVQKAAPAKQALKTKVVVKAANLKDSAKEQKSLQGKAKSVTRKTCGTAS